MSYNAQFQVPAQTVLGMASCECCGRVVRIKANKTGGAYYMCTHADEEGIGCNHQQRWGQRVSWALRKAYREAGENPVKVRLPLKIGNEKPAAPVAADPAPVANTNTAPQERPVPSRGGLFG
ncbi:zinc ribbon domain-containing protein [Epibacterium sp. Ofav1-8]|uniref:zinc ribbon domain-containing protein n=1 Tax=Epibacterium sp. Ofav1-8 TaxID=2917735 RepID=UPI001EF5F524|nr:zinc ribbon domain-containing protein [Epibacterium sp. Ofav1-8]MCG7622722.1 hypothetical protein [Epibacterium sp. Ofav1-8]